MKEGKRERKCGIREREGGIERESWVSICERGKERKNEKCGVRERECVRERERERERESDYNMLLQFCPTHDITVGQDVFRKYRDFYKFPLSWHRPVKN